jgi:putative inorganic carbon (HCO3(-)) transporter
MDAEARPRPILDLPSPGAVVVLAAGSAAALGALAVYSPRYAVFALLAAAFVVVASSRLAWAIAAFVLLTFPEHLPGSLGAGATLAKPVGALLVVAWAGAALTRRGTLPLLPRAQPLLFSVIVGLLVFGGVSVLWATAPSQTQYALGRLLQVAALFLVAFTAASDRAGFRTLIYGYLVASVATSVYSIASGHYLSSGRLATLFDPNYFAAELIPAILIACFLLVTVDSPGARWLFAIVAAVDLAAFALTQSRGGIVGMLVALIAAVVLAGRARPRILALVLVLTAVGLGYYLGYKPAHVFGSGARGGLSATSSGRLDLWRVALRVAEGHPVGGVGLGNYQTVEPAYATQALNLQFVSFIVTDRLVAHNTYLQMAAELGLVGLFLFLMILLLPLRLAARTLEALERKRHPLEFHVRGLLAGVVGMLVAYFFISAEVEKPLWFLLALLASAPALLRDEPGAESVATVA